MGSESDGVVKRAKCPECGAWFELDWGGHMMPHGCTTDGVSIYDMFVQGGVRVLVCYGSSTWKADVV